MTKWTFDHDQKVKNFKTDLSHSIFRVHSNFGTHSFIRGLKIVQTSNFQKNWLLCKCWPNVKFLRWTCLAQFFVYILILGSVSSFEIRKLHKWLKFQDSWLWCWNQPKVKIFKSHLPFSIFRVHSKFGVYFFIWESKNFSNNVILQLLALKWTLTKNQDIRAKFVLFVLSRRFWFWNPLIGFGLGDHQSNPHLWSTDDVQNLNSWDQNLRFIHLIGISSGLFSRFHQDLPFKVQMNSHKCVLKLH